MLMEQNDTGDVRGFDEGQLIVPNSQLFLGAYTYKKYIYIYITYYIIYLYGYVCMYIITPRDTHAHNKKPQMVGVYHGDPQILEPKMIIIMGSK
jgi:hypothetical protein